MYFSIGALAILFWWYCFRVILPSGSIFFADPNMVSFCEGGRSSCFSTDTNEAYIQVSKPLDVIGGSDIDWLTRTTPLSPPDDRTREPNHWPDFLSYCWPVGARVFPERWQKILKILSISLQCFILNDTTLPLVSNGMRSQFLADSGGHLKTAPPFTTSGWPESAVGAPTKSLQWRRDAMKNIFS